MKRHIVTAANLLYIFFVTFINYGISFHQKKNSIQVLRVIKNNYIEQIFRFSTRNFFERAIACDSARNESKKIAQSYLKVRMSYNRTVAHLWRTLVLR